MADNDKTAADEVASKVAGGGTGKIIKLAGICVGAMLVAGIAGYFSGGLSPNKAEAGPAEGHAAASSSEEGSSHGSAKKDADKNDGDFAYIDFEPIVVNLDEARLARYIRTAITLAVVQADHKEADRVIQRSMPEVRSWLTIKLAGCSLENVRGEKNLTRLCREIADALNARLWPNERPLIHHVLLKEVAVQ